MNLLAIQAQESGSWLYGLECLPWIMRPILYCLFICWIFPGAFAQAQDTPRKLISVLIVDGFSNHDWKQTSLMTKRILEESGRFTVSISTAPGTVDDMGWASWNPEFEKYDVVI